MLCGEYTNLQQQLTCVHLLTANWQHVGVELQNAQPTLMTCLNRAARTLMDLRAVPTGSRRTSGRIPVMASLWLVARPL